MSKLHSRTKASINIKASRMSVRNKHSLDESYFDDINSHDKAYWLGFIYADGYVCIRNENRSYMLGIELNRGDEHHLESFREAINSDCKIYRRSKTPFISNGCYKEYQMSIIRIYSKKLVESLMKHGVIPNKTYSLSFPDIKREYLGDFIRGYFDGDGSFHTYSVNGHIYSKFSFVAKDREFLVRLSEILKSFDISSHIYADRDYFVLNINDFSSRSNFFNLIYKNSSIFLKRKFEKCSSYFSLNDCPYI